MAGIAGDIEVQRIKIGYLRLTNTMPPAGFPADWRRIKVR